MSNSTDEILKRIQERLDAKGITPTPQETPIFLREPARMPNPAANSGGAVAGVTPLAADQITSEVFIVAPTQIGFIAELFANSVAEAMNMRMFAPKIRTIAEESLKKALASAKRAGKKIS